MDKYYIENLPKILLELFGTLYRLQTSGGCYRPRGSLYHIVQECYIFGRVLKFIVLTYIM